MTQRDFYNAVIATVDNDELKAFATDAIAKLDERNAKRASKPSKTQIANEPIIKAIASVLTDEPMLASKIAELCEISTQKASALVKKVDGVQSVDVKVKGKGTLTLKRIVGAISPTPLKCLLLTHFFTSFQKERTQVRFFVRRKRTYVRAGPGTI